MGMSAHKEVENGMSHRRHRPGAGLLLPTEVCPNAWLAASVAGPEDSSATLLTGHRNCWALHARAN